VADTPAAPPERELLKLAERWDQHLRGCDAIKGPWPEQWAEDKDCDCGYVALRAYLAALPAQPTAPSDEAPKRCNICADPLHRTSNPRRRGAMLCIGCSTPATPTERAKVMTREKLAERYVALLTANAAALRSPRAPQGEQPTEGA
jgi:hypothetical protein